MQLGDTIKTLRDQLGWSTPEVARRASEHGEKVTYQKIQQLEAKPDTFPRYLPQLAMAFGKSIDDLLSWRPGMPPIGPNRVPVAASEATPSFVSPHETRAGYRSFQLMDEEADYADTIREIEIAEWKLVQELGRLPSPDRVKLLTMRGDSMAPHIRNGDVVFVDTEDTKVVDGGLYVIVIHGYTLVKRIEVRTDGLHIVSFWRPDKPDIVPPSDMHNVHIAGRVLGAIQVRGAEALQSVQ